MFFKTIDLGLMKDKDSSEMRNKQGEAYSYLTLLLCKNSQPVVPGGKSQVEADFNCKAK